MFIGIDLGGTAIKAGLFTPEGEKVAFHTVLTDVAGGFDRVVGQMTEVIRKLIGQAEDREGHVLGIGVAFPGVLDAHGKVSRCINLGWENVDLEQPLREAFDIPLTMQNDATVAAYGEQAFGALRNVENGVMLTIGTGVGGGVILNGQVYDGCHHVGAELGHLLVGDESIPCNCGNGGCLEVFASATVLIKSYRELADMNGQSSTRGAITAKEIYNRAAAGEQTASLAVERQVHYLSRGIVNIINAIDPEVIVIGGGVSAAGDALLKPLEYKVAQHKFYKANPHGRLRQAELGNDAGMVGAAMMAKKWYLTSGGAFTAYPLSFRPVFHLKIWGSSKMNDLKTGVPEGIIGESWDVSVHEKGQSVIANGCYAGFTLQELTQVFEKDVLGALSLGEFDLLLKTISAGEQLSVQVHPDDQKVRGQLRSRGKNEAWYIIDAEPHAKLTVGLQEPLGILDQDIASLLTEVSVKPGQLFYVPAGAVHAIGAGITLFEVQQSSDVTYRLHDFGRGRDLHVNEAAAVIRPERTVRELGGVIMEEPGLRRKVFCASEHFVIEEWSVNGRYDHGHEGASYDVLMMLEGEITLDCGHGDDVLLKPHEPLLVPAVLRTYSLSGTGKMLRVFVTETDRYVQSIMERIVPQG